jgi:acetyl-CoA C-acetyltransferase
MGMQSERVAHDHGVSREALDEVAAASHARAFQAHAAGDFAAEIVPVPVSSRGVTKEITIDEGVREDTTPAGLGSLRPAFQADGVLTAGNSSQISDGAAALLLASEEAIRRLGLRPLARLLGGTWASGEPWRFAEAPVPAVRRLLDRLRRQVTDFDLFENNEAFALSSILFHRMLGVPHEQLNVRGGAVALGHPIGASGARLVTTLVHALEQRGQHTGLAAICHGMGGSTALAVERA